MSKKLKFEMNGVEFQLPLESYRESVWNGVTEKYIYMSAKNCASIIKQFVKQKLPHLKVWAGSDVYSGGSSVRVHVCNSDGTEVDYDEFKLIKQWKHILQGGSFNGMEDIYEYNEGTKTTDNNTPLKYFPSYVFCNNSPKWGSVEYWMNEYNNFQNMTSENPNYENYMSMVESSGGWLNMNKTYMNDKEYSNVVKALNL